LNNRSVEKNGSSLFVIKQDGASNLFNRVFVEEIKFGQGRLEAFWVVGEKREELLLALDPDLKLKQTDTPCALNFLPYGFLGWHRCCISPERHLKQFKFLLLKSF
jgi:hypothetical protein